MTIFYGVLVDGVLYSYTASGNSFSVVLDTVFSCDEMDPLREMNVKFVFTSQYRAEIILDFERIR